MQGVIEDPGVTDEQRRREIDDLVDRIDRAVRESRESREQVNRMVAEAMHDIRLALVQIRRALRRAAYY